jgi:2-phosphosulfolactate phosphatase
MGPFRDEETGSFAKGFHMKRLRVLMTREEIVPDRLAGATAVVVDVFLATTTLLTILENGARRVFPVGSIEEAEEVRKRLDASGILRGGEQNSERIEGYDLGPFPEEYPFEVVADKDVIFVTTNGTRAIADAAPAEKVLLGCLRNAPAVARHLEASETDSIYLICADGRFALDDFFGTATILSYMNTKGRHLNDAAWTALDFMERHRDVAQTLRRGRMGRWFFENRAETFEFVADVGASEVVPEVRGGRLLRVEDLGVRPAEAPGTR